MSRAIRCDGPTCVNWIKEENSYQHNPFIEMFEGEEELTFCCWECIGKFVAVKLQLEEMPAI